MKDIFVDTAETLAKLQAVKAPNLQPFFFQDHILILKIIINIADLKNQEHTKNRFNRMSGFNIFIKILVSLWGRISFY